MCHMELNNRARDKTLRMKMGGGNKGTFNGRINAEAQHIVISCPNVV